jgi:hypothetical protein
VAVGNLNVVTGSFSGSCILVERSNKLHFLQYISHNCGDSKESVATKVVNVLTETFWLDSVALKSPKKFQMVLINHRGPQCIQR